MELTGKIVIAMPALGDPRFAHSVVLICAHSDEGAMGLIVNKPVSDLSFAELLTHLNIPAVPDGRDIHVHFGGPVERGRGFVLHSPDFTSGGATLSIPGGLAMTATLDILEALGRGEGPTRAILALGYAGWGPGQLESEIGRNDWLTGEISDDLVFSTDNGAKWGRALKSLGIEPLSLSATAGRA
jgi:putative transcriptional regulator